MKRKNVSSSKGRKRATTQKLRQRLNMSVSIPRPFTKRPLNEVKCLDTTFLAPYNNVWVPDAFPQKVLNADNNGAFQSLVNIKQGNAISQRIGNKINLKSVRLRFSLDSTGVLTNTPTDTRLLLVYDRQPNGAYPTVNDFLNVIPQDGTLTNPTGQSLTTTIVTGKQIGRAHV